MYKAVIHVYEEPVPGLHNYVKTTEPTAITNICEDERLRLHGTATIDGQEAHVEGGPSSGAHSWTHYK